MASVSTDKKTGRRTIQFVAPNGKRLSIRLGRVNKKQAENAKLHIEHLLACRVGVTSPRNTTLEWLADLPDAIIQRLVRVDLIDPRKRTECPTLGDWLERLYCFSQSGRFGVVE